MRREPARLVGEYDLARVPTILGERCRQEIVQCRFAEQAQVRKRVEQRGTIADFKSPDGELSLLELEPGFGKGAAASGKHQFSVGLTQTDPSGLRAGELQGRVK